MNETYRSHERCCQRVLNNSLVQATRITDRHDTRSFMRSSGFAGLFVLGVCSTAQIKIIPRYRSNVCLVYSTQWKTDTTPLESARIMRDESDTYSAVIALIETED